MSEETKNETTKTTETTETTTETKVEKKSWFNRAWSAMTGLVIGIASMLGISQNQINTIKTDVQDALVKVQEVKTAVESKDISKAVEAIKDASTSLKKVVGEVKETTNEIKEKTDTYKTAIDNIKTAISEKKFDQAHTYGVELLKEVANGADVDNLTGVNKTIYDAVTAFIKNIEDGKYDTAITGCDKVLKLLNE